MPSRMRVRHHKLAHEELTAAAVFYEQQEEGLGAQFLEAYKEAVAMVKANPKTYRILLDDMRRFLMDRFPFVVVYRVREEETFIMAVAHGRRKPGYWRERL